MTVLIDTLDTVVLKKLDPPGFSQMHQIISVEAPGKSSADVIVNKVFSLKISIFLVAYVVQAVIPVLQHLGGGGGGSAIQHLL